MGDGLVGGGEEEVADEEVEEGEDGELAEEDAECEGGGEERHRGGGRREGLRKSNLAPWRAKKGKVGRWQS